MKVLMVTNIYPTSVYPGRGSFVKAQIDSIRREGVDVEVEYVNAIDSRLAFPKSAARIACRAYMDRFDLIHAHYGTTGIISRLQCRKPVVVSYLGSDILGNPRNQGGGKTVFSGTVALLSRLSSTTMNAVIVKSAELRRKIPRSHNVFVIPNGVDFSLFHPIEPEKARKQLGFDRKKRYVLFPSNATWLRKCFPLAEAAVHILQNQGMPVELVPVFGQSQDLIPLYMNACHAMVLTSLWEGSPNVIKESMACNLPIVSVDVGDVPEITGGCGGCFIVPRNAAAIAEKLKQILDRPFRTRGRERIRHLEMQTVARQIISIYAGVLRRKFHADTG
jgi:teichuronic acid biosynthesis glycosyltransferase TuaC